MLLNKGGGKNTISKRGEKGNKWKNAMLLTANDCNGACKMDHDLWHMHCPDVDAQFCLMPLIT